MTVLVLTGLHGSGKSHLSGIISSKFGWPVYVKRELLRRLHAESGSSEKWESWYRCIYSLDGVDRITRRVIQLLPEQGDLVLDSVHNIVEWRTVRSIRADSVLAAVVAPAAIRLARNGDEDPALDRRRVGYWHGPDGGCLISECDWCFNGAAEPETSCTEFGSLLEWLSAR